MPAKILHDMGASENQGPYILRNPTQSILTIKAPRYAIEIICDIPISSRLAGANARSKIHFDKIYY